MRRLFEVNSEPHTGARPSVRLCVGLITERKQLIGTLYRRASQAVNHFKASIILYVQQFIVVVFD